jgi:hypothetical protein
MRIHFVASTMYHAKPEVMRTEMPAMLAVEADVTVVGGDFDPDLLRSVSSLRPIAEVRPVVYVPGNLDFYSRTQFETVLATAKEVAARIGNVHVLYNESVDIGDMRFIGATMWSRVTDEMAAFARRINDFRMIPGWSKQRQNREHAQSVDFVESELMRAGNMRTAVVTHNFPDPSFTPAQYRGDPSSDFFANDLSGMMSGPFAPDLWFSGTGFATEERLVGRTLNIQNAGGHHDKPGPDRVIVPGRENPLFLPGFVHDTSPEPAPSGMRASG